MYPGFVYEDPESKPESIGDIYVYQINKKIYAVASCGFFSRGTVEKGILSPEYPETVKRGLRHP